ncbi:hypothetical protein [Breznakiella homolactica]|uniref:Uncharacterized protein n=1 Tax=Breznakiella homolactica TaxID=2798577 RepID=A0A7T8BAX4_9SPIR|nr:hypothetical protein [Breznakiella homolactica]QQO09932.1 hypothetical protein JFL75_03195 [Breznakiella homolactica]
MKYKRYLYISVFLILASNNLSASPIQERSDFYYVVNISAEDLIITVKNKEILINWDILAGDHIDYYENGKIVDRLYIDRDFRNGDYILKNHILPHNNRYIDGNFFWKYCYFFRRRTPEYIYEMNREQIVNTYGEDNADQFPQNVLFEYRKLYGNEIISIFIEEFIITDISGNLIMTLDDINEISFEANFAEAHIEEYTEDFYSLPRYRNFGNDESLFLFYGIFITDKMIEKGRLKYREVNIE